MDIKTLKTKELESQKFLYNGYLERSIFLMKASEAAMTYQDRKEKLEEAIQMGKLMAKVSLRMKELEELVATL